MQNTFKVSNEILLNATLVSDRNYTESYEFVLNEHLKVIECVKIVAAMQGAIAPITRPEVSLEGRLFELNHVRVNPHLDNTVIIGRLTQAFEDLGVSISNRPQPTSIAVTYKPMGEMSDNIRFAINSLGGETGLVFYSPARRFRLVP